MTKRWIHDTTIELLRQSGPAGIEPLINALLTRLVRVRHRTAARDDLGFTYADSREAYDLAVRHFGAGSAQQLRAAHNPDVYVDWTLGTSVRRRSSRRSLYGHRDALDAARSNADIAEGNVDLLNAELLFGVLLCRFRNSDDGIRRCRDVAAIASKHHGDESLTVELAFDTWLSACGGTATQEEVPRWQSARTGWRRRAMSPRHGDSRQWRTWWREWYATPSEPPNVPNSRTKPWCTPRRCLRGRPIADAWTLRMG